MTKFFATCSGPTWNLALEEVSLGDDISEIFLHGCDQEDEKGETNSAAFSIGVAFKSRFVRDVARLLLELDPGCKVARTPSWTGVWTEVSGLASPLWSICWTWSEDDDLSGAGWFLLDLDDSQLTSIIQSYPDAGDVELRQLARMDVPSDDLENLDFSNRKAISLFINRAKKKVAAGEKFRADSDKKKLDEIDRQLENLTKTLRKKDKPLSARHLNRMVETGVVVDQSDLFLTLREWLRLEKRIGPNPRNPLWSGGAGFLIWLFSSRSDEECASILANLSRSSDLTDSEILAKIGLLVEDAIEVQSESQKSTSHANFFASSVKVGRSRALSRLKRFLV